MEASSSLTLKSRVRTTSCRLTLRGFIVCLAFNHWTSDSCSWSERGGGDCSRTFSKHSTLSSQGRISDSIQSLSKKHPRICWEQVSAWLSCPLLRLIHTSVKYLILVSNFKKSWAASRYLKRTCLLWFLDVLLRDETISGIIHLKIWNPQNINICVQPVWSHSRFQYAVSLIPRHSHDGSDHFYKLPVK